MSRLSGLRRALRGTLTENLNLKGISLLLAVGLWAWLQSEQVVEGRARAVLELRWPEHLVPIDEPPTAVAVTVSGPQGRMRALPERELRIEVDLREAAEGTNSVDLRELPLTGLPDGVDLVQLNPPLLDVELDKRRSRRVRLRPTLLGEPAEGWQRGAVRVEPEMVEITGPQSLVRNVTEAATDIVDITGARMTRSVSVPLVFPRSSIRTVEPVQAQVTVDISPILSARRFTEVPVGVRATGFQTPAAQAEVELVGPIKALEALDPAKVKVWLELPPAVPVGGPVELRFDPTRPDGPVGVRHGGDAKGIRVQSITPDTFTLIPQE